MDENVYHVGQRVLIKSAMWGVKEAVIRGFRWNEDGDSLVVVDFDPPSSTSPVGGHLGWVFDQRQIIGPVVTQPRPLIKL